MHSKNNGLIITIDGPAGAGKSTLARNLAQKIGYRYINTGDLYRYITYRALQENLDIKNCEEMTKLSKKIVHQFMKENNSKNSLQLFINQKKTIMEKIRSPEINKNVSYVAQCSSVRKNMVPLQRILARGGSVIIEGRDIGSVILPNADIKFFIDANEQTRIMRRYKELKEKGYAVTFFDVKKEITTRDSIDSKRKIAPLIKPKDAIEINTSNKNIDEIIETMFKIIEKHLREKLNYGNI